MKNIIFKWNSPVDKRNKNYMKRSHRSKYIRKLKTIFYLHTSWPFSKFIKTRSCAIWKQVRSYATFCKQYSIKYLNESIYKYFFVTSLQLAWNAAFWHEASDLLFSLVAKGHQVSHDKIPVFLLDSTNQGTCPWQTADFDSRSPCHVSSALNPIKLDYSSAYLAS